MIKIKKIKTEPNQNTKCQSCNSIELTYSIVCAPKNTKNQGCLLLCEQCLANLTNKLKMDIFKV